MLNIKSEYKKRSYSQRVHSIEVECTVLVKGVFCHKFSRHSRSRSRCVAAVWYKVDGCVLCCHVYGGSGLPPRPQCSNVCTYGGVDAAERKRWFVCVQRCGVRMFLCVHHRTGPLFSPGQGKSSKCARAHTCSPAPVMVNAHSVPALTPEPRSPGAARRRRCRRPAGAYTRPLSSST